MNAFEQLTVSIALDRLFKEKYFNICTIQKVLDVTGTVPDGRTMRALSLLHCVNYSDMPRELLQQLPDMVAHALNGPAMEISGINFVFDSKTQMPRALPRSVN